MRRSLVLTLALLSGSAGAQLAFTPSGGGGKQIFLKLDQKLLKLDCPFGAKPLSWSIDGRWLVLGEPQKEGLYKLALVDAQAPEPTIQPLAGECSAPSWQPNGKRFVYEVGGKGIFIFDLSGKSPESSLLLPSGKSPSWSPNGGRIALLPVGNEAGVIVCDENGQHLRHVNTKLKARRLAWAPDGRSLAVVSKGAIWLLPASGRTSAKLTAADDAHLEFSPDGKRLLCAVKGSWGCLELGTGAWSGFSVLFSNPPTWMTSHRVVGVSKDHFAQIGLGGTFVGSPAVAEDQAIDSFAICRGIVLDGNLRNPFARLPRPNQGETRLTGTVSSVDLADGLVTLSVSTIQYPDGRELNMTAPKSQDIQLTPNSRKALAGRQSTLTIGDFLPEDEVSVTVQVARGAEGQKLPIRTASFANLSFKEEVFAPTNPSSNALPGGVRGRRTLEFDGVSMDKVTVPMLFPVCGRVSWSDTFLTSRDGGNRRHHGQDLMAPKMRPLVAAFDGDVRLNKGKTHNTITLTNDEGWSVTYMHVNNDTPGTEDCAGSDLYAFAPGLRSGDRVVQGQLVGFCGNSGNAKGGAAHCHFELSDDVGGGVLNALSSLQAATHADEPITIDPAPSLKPAEGEVRWDIEVTSVDETRNVLVGELIAKTKDGVLKMNLMPQKVYLKIGTDAKIHLRNMPEESRRFEDIKAGTYLTAIGSIPQPGKALEPNIIALSLSWRE